MIKKSVKKSIIELTQGDITHQVIDVIVNAANPSLMGGDGVDGAIHREGGPQILHECKQIRKVNGDCETGKAVITTAGRLKAKKIIHTVGPIWNGGNNHEPEMLASAYRSSLKLASELEFKTIAFPSISTGAYGYPVEHAAHIAMKTIYNFLRGETSIELVRFVLFEVKSFDAYKKALNNLN